MAIHGFLFKRGVDAIVRLFVKDSALCREEEWRGEAVDMTQGTLNGWKVFKRDAPTGLPTPLAPNAVVLSAKKRKSVLHDSVKQLLDARGKLGAIQWLENVIQTGIVPRSALKQRVAGDVGPKTTIEYAGEDAVVQAEVQYIDGEIRSKSLLAQASPLLPQESLIKQSGDFQKGQLAAKIQSLSKCHGQISDTKVVTTLH